MAYGSVAVPELIGSYIQYLFTSTDGKNWSKKYYNDLTGLINSITYGNDIYLAVSGGILTSPDGAIWTAVGQDEAVNLRKGIYANGVFVVVGDNGSIITSPDGISWTRRALATTKALRGIAFGNGIYDAVGQDGTIITSEDLSSWTVRDSGTTTFLHSVTYGNGLFIGVGEEIDNILLSNDGINWQKIEEISNLENILTDILYFAKPAVPKCTYVDINGIVRNILEVLAVEMEENAIRTEHYPDASLPLLCLDENQIRRVIINIIKNAIQAIPDGGTITVTTQQEDQWVKVEIADTGIRISDEDIDKLFDAFFSSKSTGSRLGLTVSAQIINNHGGTIEVMRRIPKGTIFIIKLPIASPMAAVAS